MEPFTNYWGSDVADVDPDYCAYCERRLPGHYNSCNTESRRAAELARESALSGFPVSA